MSINESERSTTHWPGGDSEVPTESVLRVICVSRSEVRGPVLDEMRRIRERAVVNNGRYGIRVALLNMSGWFVQWIEGPGDGVDALLDRVSGDQRHHGLEVVHRSEGRPRLFRPWMGSMVQTSDSDRQFALRVRAQMARFEEREVVEPAVVWGRLSAPPAPDMPRPQGRQPRVMLLSAQGAQAFNFLEWLVQREARTLVRRRFAGGADDVPDVESDYADFPAFGPRGLRLTANARKGLAMGMMHAFLPDCAAVVLRLDGNAERNIRLVDRVIMAFRQVHHSPMIVAWGGRGQVSAEIQDLVERQGMPWLAAATESASPDSTELWEALVPHLERLG
ncbi:MAG: BLUF domain-containing protein [Hydrogenophaga sp.]